MKLLFLIVFSLMFGFASQGAFAETEMTGWLRIMDSYSTDPGPHPYIITFHPNEETSYTLNPNTMSSGVLDWAGKQVRVTVDDDTPLASSFDADTQFLDITSIGLISQSSQVSASVIPPTVRSVTLLSDFTDSGPTPTEGANTSPGQFINPQGVAVDGSGNIYVVEQGQGFPLPTINHRVQKFNPNGEFMLKFGTPGTGDGQFAFPSDIAVDSLGNIYAVDNNNHRIQKFDTNGVFVAKAGVNGGDGTLGTGAGEFHFPFGIAVDGSDNVYVTDFLNHRIQVLDSSLTFIKMFGWGVDTGASAFEICTTSCQAGAFVGSPGALPGPRGIAFDGSGNIYVSDAANRIQKFSSAPAFVTQFGSMGFTEGLFDQPRGVAVDDSGNIYVADRDNHRIQKFSAATNFVSMWGWDVTVGGGTGFEICTSGCKDGVADSGDGQLDTPEGIAFDGSGNIYVADFGNNRVKKFMGDGTHLPLEEKGYDGSLIHDDAYYQGIFYDNPGSLKNFYAASSWGKFDWSGEVSDWTSLPSSNGSYLPHSNANFDQMVADSIAAHEGTVDFCDPSPVTNLILIFNGQVASGPPPVNTAFGSLGTWNNVPQNKIPWDTLDGCSITISVSWEPDNGGFFCCGQTLDRGIGVTGHEVGHNLGLEHTPPQEGAWTSAGPWSDPYHDPNSIMSNNRDREGPSALIMGQRDQVGWVIAGNKVPVADGTTETVTLDFINEAEGGANPQMAIIPLPDGTSYVVEAHRDEIHNDTPQDRTGAIMYRYFPSGNQYAYLTFDPRDMDAEYSLVATDGTALETDFDRAILEVGEEYEDVANSVTVETLSIGATSVTVSISNNGASPCSPQAGQHWVITVSCTLTGSVTADKNITVQNNSVLTIPVGMIVFFDPSTYSITVVDGSGILVQGSIQTTP